TVCKLHSFPTRRSSDLRLGVQRTIDLDFHVQFVTEKNAVLIRKRTKADFVQALGGVGKELAINVHSRFFFRFISFIESLLCSFRSEEHTSELQSREKLV